MSISGIMPSSLGAAFSSLFWQPQYQTSGLQKTPSDAVSISSQAQKLVSDGDTAVRQASETTAVKDN